MKHFLNDCITKFNKNNYSILSHEDFLNINKNNILNIDKIDNKKYFIMNLNIVKFNDNIKNFIKDIKDEININILLYNNEELENFIFEFNTSVKNRIFTDYIIFIKIINFNTFPSNLLNTQELIYNNIFIYQTKKFNNQS